MCTSYSKQTAEAAGVHGARHKRVDFLTGSEWTKMRMGGLKRGEFVVYDSAQVCAEW
jgi:hypothetical protein